MNELIPCSGQLIKTDQIKTEFVMYGYKVGNSYSSKLMKRFLSGKYNYFLQEQNNVFMRYDWLMNNGNYRKMEIDDVLDYVKNNNQIPDRFKFKVNLIDLKQCTKPVMVNETIYRLNKKIKKYKRLIAKGNDDPKVNTVYLQYQLKECKNNLYFYKEFKLCEFVFPVAIISLMKHKDMHKKIVSLFEDLNMQSGGVSFDEYIDNWADKIISDMFVKEEKGNADNQKSKF